GARSAARDDGGNGRARHLLLADPARSAPDGVCRRRRRARVGGGPGTPAGLRRDLAGSSMRFRRVLHALVAPAPDPRLTYRDPGGLGPELLTGIRAALDRIASSRAQLEARTAELRERVALLEGQAR